MEKLFTNKNQYNGILKNPCWQHKKTTDLAAAGLQLPENNQIQEVSTRWNPYYIICLNGSGNKRKLCMIV